MLVHIDTDFAGDIDDACALAMVLGWPDAEISAITTVADPDGVRAAYARITLELVARGDIPVHVGAGRSLAGFEMGGVPEHDRFWDVPVVRRPAGADDAVGSLRRSIEAGATVVAIGPYTNLALLERETPGILKNARLVLMGGYQRRHVVLRAARPRLPRQERAEGAGRGEPVHA